MKFVTHNTARPKINAMGTGLCGYLDASYDQIVEKFGEPMGPSGDGKVRAEWHIRFPNGMVATIYDYKADSRGDLKKFRAWHIGGRHAVLPLVYGAMLGINDVTPIGGDIDFKHGFVTPTPIQVTPR